MNKPYMVFRVEDDVSIAICFNAFAPAAHSFMLE